MVVPISLATHEYYFDEYSIQYFAGANIYFVKKRPQSKLIYASCLKKHLLLYIAIIFKMSTKKIKQKRC